ncbi:MAG: DNA-directed RNA polymerase subunit A' [Nanoarchaeota archaeon]|nr:DNA-directed RNA polymerase subunit A' [Nanoarchaeota archaeon]
MRKIIRDKIGSITFKLMSPYFIKKMSVMKVISPELYDEDGYPVEGGLMDPKMGVVDPGLRCRTCGSKVKECSGHFGYIELARPVTHVEYAKNIYDFLRGTCNDCGRILLAETNIKKYLEEMEEAKKNMGEAAYWEVTNKIRKKLRNASKCPHCKAKQDKITIRKPTGFAEDNVKLTQIDVRERLEKMSDEDCLLLGLNPDAGRPEWMVLTLLPVPPVIVRPSITLASGQRSEDDLTHKLGDIVRTNQRLWENLNAGAPEIIIEDLWELLQYHVTTFIANDKSQVPPARHRSGRPLKTLSERIKSKEGRMRRNLAGKRVDFSARTVISPETMIGIDEVGLPVEAVMELTIPERVTEWNLKHLKKYVKNGPEKYPGANYVITPDGKRKRITDETKKVILEELALGYIVERHLINGDICLFNRQPSLHKMSIMCHKIRILPYKTFGMNLCVTPPYNADFDGDEMNLHIPQTEEARAEAKHLMSVHTQMITPRYGLPIIGCKHDHLTGLYLLSKDQKIPRRVATALLAQAEVETSLPVKKTYKGIEILSQTIPEKINYAEKTITCQKCDKCKEEKCEHECFLKIKKGEIKCGFVDSNAVGAGTGLLLKKMLREYGGKELVNFLQKITLLSLHYLDYKGFTVLPSHTDLKKESFKKVKNELDDAKNKTKKILEKYEKGQLESLPGRTVKETLEVNLLTTTRKTRNKIGRIVQKEIKKDNSLYVMASSGARGKLVQIGLMSASVGQQSLRGSRINFGYRDRALPHFKKGDMSPEAHGFIRHGYKGGLTPTEFFFHAMIGRDNLMDTSMRTPKSGYLQRRLINTLQDVSVNYDQTVRDSGGRIIEFEYGEDGIDVTKSQKGKLDVKEVLK